MSFLTRKYPFEHGKHCLRDSIAYGIVIWAILYLLQPFGFSHFTGNKFLVAVIFGIITSCCYFFYVWAILKRLPRHIKPWRIWHEGLAILGLILFIAAANVITFSCIFHYPITLESFWLMLYWTLIIGIIITTVSVGIQYNRFLRDKMEALLSNTTEEQKDLSITIHDTNIRGNDLSMTINNLLYIEVKKNNVSVCYMKDEQVTFSEVHATLSAVIEELKEYKNILQCHRSFVINVNNITSARGNSNGYQLTLGSCPNSIPVSRSFVPKLREFIA